MVFLSPWRQMPRQFLHYATTASSFPLSCYHSPLHGLYTDGNVKQATQHLESPAITAGFPCNKNFQREMLLLSYSRHPFHRPNRRRSSCKFHPRAGSSLFRSFPIRRNTSFTSSPHSIFSDNATCYRNVQMHARRNI